jgi:hypothetical protein
MKTSILVAGIVILIIGLGVAVYGIYYPATKPTTTTVVPASSRSVDANGMWSFGVNLQKGETLNGTAQILSYNQTAGPIFFYIQNESTFIYWGGCAPCSLPSGGYNGLENYTLPSNGVKTFTWTAPYAGAFYLIFDNENYNQKANATLQANGTVPSSGSAAMNPTIVAVGAAVAIIGAVIAGAGVIMKTSGPAPQKGTP